MQEKSSKPRKKCGVHAAETHPVPSGKGGAALAGTADAAGNVLWPTVRQLVGVPSCHPGLWGWGEAREG